MIYTCNTNSRMSSCVPHNFHFCFVSSDSSVCWQVHQGYYIKEGHFSGNCYPLEEAKAACEAASDCHGIATQSNYCRGQWRVSHGATATLIFYSIHHFQKSAYTLDRSCLESPPKEGMFIVALYIRT